MSDTFSTNTFESNTHLIWLNEVGENWTDLRLKRENGCICFVWNTVFVSADSGLGYCFCEEAQEDDRYNNKWKNWHLATKTVPESAPSSVSIVVFVWWQNSKQKQRTVIPVSLNTFTTSMVPRSDSFFYICEKFQSIICQRVSVGWKRTVWWKLLFSGSEKAQNMKLSNWPKTRVAHSDKNTSYFPLHDCNTH